MKKKSTAKRLGYSLILVCFIPFLISWSWGWGNKAEKKFEALVKQEDSKIKEDFKTKNYTIELACCQRYLGISSHNVQKTSSADIPYKGEITFKCYDEPSIVLDKKCWNEHKLTYTYEYIDNEYYRNNHNGEGGWSSRTLLWIDNTGK